MPLHLTRYDEAVEAYEQAERNLDTLIEFENTSPTKNVSRLQRYQNSKTFIKARIQLGLIADDVSRLETRDNR